MISELQLLGVFERGIPNKEHVIIRPTIPLEMGSYALMVGARTLPPDDLVIPVRDFLFWFGTAILQSVDWIFVYTGHGTPIRIPTADSSGHIYICYWNHSQTIFHDPQYVPLLVRMNGVRFEPRPVPVAQSSNLLTNNTS